MGWKTQHPALTLMQSVVKNVTITSLSKLHLYFNAINKFSLECCLHIQIQPDLKFFNTKT